MAEQDEEYAVHYKFFACHCDDNFIVEEHFAVKYVINGVHFLVTSFKTYSYSWCAVFGHFKIT